MYRRRLSRIHSIDDFRSAARRILPRMVFDYIDGGADSESTVRENRAALDRLRLVPAALVDVRQRSRQVELFGKPSAAPIVIGPTGLLSAFWPDGALHLARAAGRHGIPFVMSNSANVSIEAVAKAGNGRKWFQMYLPHSRDIASDWMVRLAANGFELLELTVDSTVPGQRLRDTRNGFAIPYSWTPRKLLDVALHPEWALRMAPHPVPRPLLTIDGQQGGRRFKTVSEGVGLRLNPGVTWDDVKWLRDKWHGPLVVKGLTDPRAIPAALAAGIDGVVVSNHGGRQLDGGVATIDVLPEFTSGLADKMTVLIDSGFRTGVDILKAVALGARAVQIGRATVYAVATAGEAGADRALSLLEAELDTAMALCGVSALAEITPAWLRRSPANAAWSAPPS
jgi:(S)-mandelate dehydrogenase